MTRSEGYGANEEKDVGAQLDEALETLRAIREGEVDALVVSDGSPGQQVFTLSTADRPYRMFVESMRDGAVTLSDAGIILYANRSMAALLSRSLLQLVGSPLSAFVEERHHAALNLQNLAAGSGAEIEIELLGADGRLIPVQVGATTLEVDSERLVCLTFFDLTQVRRDQEELSRAHARAVEGSRQKSEFVANMSHEIRTPLNGVLGMSAMLLETALDEEQREYADAVRASGDCLMAVIEAVLSFSKMEAGKLDLERVPFDLRALAEEVCTIVAVPAHAKGVEVLAWVESSVPAMVLGDQTRLRQVLTNLLANAVKFTEVGEVRLRVTDGSEAGEPRLRIEVADSGIGMEPDVMVRIFDAFSQADGSTTRRFGGTGLGLTISKQLVELMGGEIGVESVELKGSTFWFTLPLEPAVSEAPLWTPSARLHGVRVLAVDDNTTGLGLLERQLEEWGMACETRTDGSAALDALLRAETFGLPFDLVLLDANLPGMSGMELAAAIRSRAANARVPILMLSPPQRGREAARSAGVDGFVTKPVRQARLYEAIVTTLDLDGPAPHAGDGGAESVTNSPGCAPDPAAGGDAGDGRLVLLVEDNEINQLVAVRMLGKAGFQVDVAINGRVALEMYDSNPYEAIFMDCQMPELDGYETTAEIRRREGSGRRLPIIAMTANTMSGDREKCLAAGMDDYVGKPVDPLLLGEAIARAIPSGASGFGVEASVLETGDAARIDRLPLVDRTALDELCEDDVDMLRELVALFEEQSLVAVMDIARAVELADAESLMHEAHQLKGSASSVGALRLAELGDLLHDMGQAGAWPDAPALLDELERTWKATCDAWDRPR